MASAPMTLLMTMVNTTSVFLPDNWTDASTTSSQALTTTVVPERRYQHDDHIGTAMLLFAVLLTVQPLLLAVLVMGLLKYKRATRDLIRSRIRFHERAVLIHENYLTLPTFVNDAAEWRRRYEKARADFDYTLAILAPTDGDGTSSQTISARRRACVALKSQAERRFADLKSDAKFGVDDRAAWLTKFIEDNSKERATEMEQRLIGVGLDIREKRRIRDERRLARLKRRQQRGRFARGATATTSTGRGRDTDGLACPAPSSSDDNAGRTS